MKQYSMKSKSDFLKDWGTFEVENRRTQFVFALIKSNSVPLYFKEQAVKLHWSLTVIKSSQQRLILIFEEYKQK